MIVKGPATLVLMTYLLTDIINAIECLLDSVSCS